MNKIKQILKSLVFAVMITILALAFGVGLTYLMSTIDTLKSEVILLCMIICMIAFIDYKFRQNNK